MQELTDRRQPSAQFGLPLADVSLEDVSTLLKHRSLRTTERYYTPWNLARKKRLVATVWAVQPRMPSSASGRRSEDPGAGTAGTVPANGSAGIEVRQARSGPAMCS